MHLQSLTPSAVGRCCIPPCWFQVDLIQSLMRIFYLLVLLALLGVFAFHQVKQATFDLPAQFKGVFETAGFYGQRYHVRCWGLESRPDSPVVVLHHDNFMSLVWFNEIQSVLEERGFASCAVDRPGIGLSPYPQAVQPPDLKQETKELHEVVTAVAGASRKYVALGYGSGGLYAQTQAADFPQQVVGLVLLDGFSRSTYQCPKVVAWLEDLQRNFDSSSWATSPLAQRSGARRLAALYDPQLVHHVLPPQPFMRAPERGLQLLDSHFSGSIRHLRNTRELCSQVETSPTPKRKAYLLSSDPDPNGNGSLSAYFKCVSLHAKVDLLARGFDPVRMLVPKGSRHYDVQTFFHDVMKAVSYVSDREYDEKKYQ